ncbi:MFS transporter [Streptomyces sp. NPDC002133]|uniref:MFS transporter n=1 Tax=Streptomyces sp. NPDC002133 TaxID=3154409 RepID=UPI00331AB60E
MSTAMQKQARTHPHRHTKSGGRGLRQLLLAQSLSQFGFWLMSLAMPLLAATTLRASPFEVSAVAASQTAAFLLVGLPAGAWVDRLRKRPVMIATDIGRALVLGSVPVVWALGHLSIGYLCAAALATGVLTVFFDVADQSFLPHLVRPQQLVSANARLVGVEQVAAVAGPGTGGLVIQLTTAPLALIGTAVGYLWSAVCLMFIRDHEPAPVRDKDTRLFRDVAEGVRYVLADRFLRPLVCCSTTMTLFWSMGYAMLLVLLAQDLAVPAGTIGLLFTFGSLGGLGATVVARRIIDALGDSTTIKLSVAVAAPFTLFSALVQPGWRLGLVSVSSFVFGAGLVLYNVAQVSFRQRSVTAALLGRVNATVRFCAWGARPLGALCGGAIAELVGVRQAVWVGAAGTSLAIVWLLLSPLRGLRTLPMDAATEDRGTEDRITEDAVTDTPIADAPAAEGAAAADAVTDDAATTKERI